MRSPVLDALARGGGTITTRELKALGISATATARLVSEEVLLRVSRGAFVDRARFLAEDLDGRHVLRSLAVARAWPRGVVVSHGSAALLMGLPLLRRPVRVHGARRANGQHRKRPAYTIHSGYPDARTRAIQGVEVLEPRYVVLGLAETQGRDAAVVAGDAALHRKLVSRVELADAADLCRYRPGHAVFSRAIELMDARTESPGESRTRLVLGALGYDVEPQVVIRDGAGGFLARVDLLVRGTRVVIEFDGMSKYSSPDDLITEKQRETRLRRAGYVVVRLIWADLDHPDKIGQLVEDALEADRRALAG